MYSVFSQIILKHWKLKHQCKDVPSEIYDDISKAIDGYYPQIMYCHVISTLDYIAEEAFYTLCTNKEVRKVAEWVCEHIVNQMKQDFKRQTTNVKIRIAVDMLNKLEYEGKISKELNLFYFDNIVTNCQELWFDVHFAPLDELPF